MKHIYIILGLVAAFFAGGLFGRLVIPQSVQKLGAVAQVTVQDLIVNGNATTVGSILFNNTSTLAANGGTVAQFYDAQNGATGTLDMTNKPTCLGFRSASGTVIWFFLGNQPAGQTGYQLTTSTSNCSGN